MQDQAMTSASKPGDDRQTEDRSRWRALTRDLALQNALRKRTSGVPTYSVPEAAALLSISQEHLYRLVREGGFPAVRMRRSGDQGRYVVPAQAVEKLLRDATAAGSCVDIAEWAKAWSAEPVTTSKAWS